MSNPTSSPEQTTVADLIAAVQQGGAGAQRAFERLIGVYQPLLLPFAITKLGSVSDAEDLLQECWIKVWQKLPTHFKGGNLKAWLFEILRNMITDHGRSHRRTFGLIEEGMEVADRRSDGVEEEQERLQALKDCLEGLEEERARIVRFRWAGIDFKEIAEQLSIPANTAMTMFHRAKDALRKCTEGKLA